VSAALTAGGYTVGRVTSSARSTRKPQDTAIEYPAAQLAQATRLADALHASRSLLEAQVKTVTLLLTPTDPAGLVAALATLPAACAAAPHTP
jgi:hypothetical protein